MKLSNKGQKIVDELLAEADYWDMEVDWELLKLVPKSKPKYNRFDMSDADHMAIDDQGWE